MNTSDFDMVNIGDEGVNSNDSNPSMDYSAAAVVRVKTLHISSPILAAKSPFFYKVWTSLLYRVHCIVLPKICLLSSVYLLFAAFLQWDEGIRAETCHSQN